MASLVGWMQQEGVAVTHASGGLDFPDPYKIGRHEPDALGTRDGVVWIGEAKIGSDLSDQTSQQQFADFSQQQMSDSGSPCPFVLCVPQAFANEAMSAVTAAGGSTENLTVIA